MPMLIKLVIVAAIESDANTQTTLGGPSDATALDQTLDKQKTSKGTKRKNGRFFPITVIYYIIIV